MYARMDRASGQHNSAESRCGLMGFSSSTPGLLGSITLGQLAGPAEVHLTFWDTQAGAASFPGPGALAAGLPGLVYEVADARKGPAAACPPSYALLPYLDGPRLPDLTAAADRAWRQRLWPGIRGVAGLVACYVLHDDDLGTVIVHLGTTLEALEAIGRAVRSSELLPGEDPALLPGPDRIEFHHVTGYRAPVARPAATSKGR